MKFFLVTILFLSSFLMNAQFSGKAIYKSHRKTNIKLDSATIAKNPQMQKMLEAKMKEIYQQTYVLNFTQTESTYKQKAKLEGPNPQASKSGVMVMSFGSGGGNEVLYKNVKEKRYTDKVDLMGKAFLVKDDIRNYDWKMTGNTKSIGKYTVYEASWTREEEDIDMKFKNNKVEKKVNKEMKTTTAWYTPDIPISNGPGNWSGLPGLILEVNDGDLTLVCTEVEFNPSERTAIKEPTKGKVVTQEKYEEIAREKAQEFLERSTNKRNGFIQIGG